MASDAFLVAEDWISEHYFTTDSTKESFQGRVVARRKLWDEAEDAGEHTPRSRVADIRGELISALAALSANDEDALAGLDLDAHRTRVLEPLATALGFRDSLWHRSEQGPVTLLAPADTPDVVGAALVTARPVADIADLVAKNESTLIDPLSPGDGSPELTSVARTLSWLFAGEDAPAFAVVLAGSKALVAERTRWAEGRYLAIDLQLVLDRGDQRKRGGEFDRAVASLAAESVLPSPEGTVWWAETLDDSVKHTVGVSKDLRNGVRESIEIIANEVVTRRADKGLSPLPRSEANLLARQALRYLYRILFLLYAETSPELNVLPVGTPEYESGYGLDRLRELVLVELGEESRHRTHLHASLQRLFRLVDAGHQEHGSTHVGAEDETLPEGLTFNSLNADLFDEDATSLIDEVGLGDGAVQRVLALLLLTRDGGTRRGAVRGFISYADLGINQLGAVYEGLMSYTGFFAETDLYEVAKDGDSSKGSWVVPVDRFDGIASKDFVLAEDPFTGEKHPRRYRNGEFVYRLSGRERQTSASYYSPEVLTKFVVSQALEELLDQNGETTTAEQILGMTICEPALGSGAFAIEAVRQLAEQYLSRREKEVGERIDPDRRPQELQKVKAAIALHQVHGVDLNATAIELAEISLWLDTMVAGLQAPWFGLRLRRGNSLIGARRAVYSEGQVKDRSWLKDAPTDIPVSTLADDMTEGRVGSATSGKIHHFLLPAEGWGAAVDAKEAKQLAPEARAALRAWRTAIRRKPSPAQMRSLKALGMRVETLWQFTLRRLEIAESQVRREVELWEDPRAPQETSGHVSRDQIEKFLHDPNGAYQRLRRVMDAWCALWFWPLTDQRTNGATPPTLDEWIDGVTALLGHHAEAKPRAAAAGQQMLGLPTTWGHLAQAEEMDLGFAGAEPVEDALAERPWLVAAQNIADDNGFFHWELDFASVFKDGGFDLQVGNPPWVRPRSDVDALLAEGDPWWQLKAKSTAAEDAQHRAGALAVPGVLELVVSATGDIAATAAFVGSSQLYPYLAGLQPDLYRCFMSLTWAHTKPAGLVGLIHLESHFTDESAGRFRAETYRRLHRHWQFINELKLFEIQDQKRFGVNVYGDSREPRFVQAVSLYHPSTVEASLKHDGSGSEPGIKDLDGHWDLRPHSSRIVSVDPATLASWHAVLEVASTPVYETRMVYAVNRSTATVLEKLARVPRLAGLELRYSAGWHEKNDRTKGFFDSDWGVPESWDSVILQGPHLFVGTPAYKQPNPTMLSHLDWTEIDLEALTADAIPATSYKPRGDRAAYDAAYTQWRSEPDGSVTSARQHYRVAWRNMAANTGERTFIPALIPPGAAHIHGVSSVGLPSNEPSLVAIGAFASSLIHDFAVRVAPKSTISAATLDRLPFIDDPAIRPLLVLRSLRLNALTSAYAKIWSRSFDERFADDAWTDIGLSYPGRPELGSVPAEWTPVVPIRRAADRRQALLEIDVLVAIALRVTADELGAIYRTQFPVLYGYDSKTSYFDRLGRQVPASIVGAWKRAGASSDSRFAWSHPGSGARYEFEAPFSLLDRGLDLKAAYTALEERVAARRENSV